MKKYDVELLPAAYSDLDEIFDYILVDNPRAAVKMLDRMMQSLHYLEKFPLSGSPLIDCSIKNFRMVIVDPYIAFYRFIDNKIYVYRVIHGARNYRHLLKDTTE